MIRNYFFLIYNNDNERAQVVQFAVGIGDPNEYLLAIRSHDVVFSKYSFCVY